MSTVTYSVPNIHCGHCIHTITTELKELAGVQDVKAAADSKRVEVSGSQLDDAAIRAAIEEAGYDVAAVTLVR